MSEIAYRIERSASRKHTYITIQKDGSVLVKANRWITQREIAHFVKQKQSWIQKRQKQIEEAQRLRESSFYLLGELHPKGEMDDDMIEALYKTKTREIVPPLVEKYSRLMQLYPTRLSFRKNRSRWGSCSGKDALSFNTRLAQTPFAFIEYVVVHELAHIQHKNHSREFWELVEHYLPDYRQRQKCVKERGYFCT